MKMNPVYRQETTAGSRSFKLPLVILIFNSILALVALLDMYSMISQVRQTAEIQYSSFLSLYVFAASVEFVMLLFLVPAMTAGSISGERERRTLNLLLTTKMTAGDVVIGKMAANLSTILLLIVSSFPILALVFIYGGITILDAALLLLCYVTQHFSPEVSVYSAPPTSANPPSLPWPAIASRSCYLWELWLPMSYPAC